MTQRWLRRGMCCAVAVAALMVLPCGALGQGKEETAKAKQDEAPAALSVRPRWVEGRRSRYTTWTLRQQNTSMSVNGESQSASMRMEVDGEITWAVDRVKSDGSATCTMTLDWLAVTLTMDDGEVRKVDSRRASGDVESMQRIAKGLAGQPIKVEMAADGSVISVTGAEAIQRRVGSDIPTPNDLDFMESANELAAIAAAPVASAIGTKWDAAFAWRHEMGTLHHAMKYAVASEEDVAGIPLVTVTGTAALKLEVDASKLPPAGGPKVDVKLARGTAETQIMFDAQRGEAVGRNTLQHTLIHVKVHLPNNVTINRTIDETIQGQSLRIAEDK